VSSAQAQRAFLEAPTPLALFTQDGRLLLQNAASLHVFGEWGDFVARFSNPAVGEQALRRLRDERVYRSEAYLFTLDGTRRFVCDARLITDGDGGQALLLEHRPLSTRDSGPIQRQLALAFEQSSDPHLLFDASAAICDCNVAALELFGASDKAQLVGLTPLDLSPELQPDGTPSSPAAEEIVARAQRDGSVRFEWTHRRLSGELFPAEVTITAMMLDGRAALFSTVHDMSERKREQEAMIESREAALEASRVKSQFLANMSHEIRTPMHGVIGMLTLALGTELSAEQRDFLNAARASADGLLAVINDILDLSKLEAGRLSLENLEVDLEDVLRASFQTTALKAHAKSIELSVELSRDVPPLIMSDPIRLRQVLVNLIGNAVKFTERGHVIVSVGVATEPDGRVLRIAIEDTGIGISAERQEGIFDAFEQADNSTTRHHGGSGLGLTISRELIARMGGRLRVISAEGVGSTFMISIPLRLPEQPLSRPPPPRLDGQCIVLVEDHFRVREQLARVLETRGAKVLRCENVGDALAACREQATVNAVMVDDTREDGHDPLSVPGRFVDVAACRKARFVLLRSQPGISSKLFRGSGYELGIEKPVFASDLDRVLHAPAGSPTGQFSSPPSTTLPRTAQVLRLLVVEDHPVNAHFLCSLLKRWGHHVVHAWNGSSALTALASEPFDTILMDVQMPVMDGLETTRRIRAAEIDGVHTPIIALTANAMKGDEEDCLQAGMDAYLAKPLDADLLQRVLERLNVGRKLASVRTTRRLSVQRASEQNPAFARDKLLERACRDVGLEADLIRIFLSTHDEMMHAIEACMESGDLVAQRHAAHRLKGALQLVCAEPAAALALELERGAREGRAITREQLDALAREMSRLQRALGEHAQA
jgi:two-component system sensor histidine kinase/response regulator